MAESTEEEEGGPTGGIADEGEGRAEGYAAKDREEKEEEEVTGVVRGRAVENEGKVVQAGRAAEEREGSEERGEGEFVVAKVPPAGDNRFAAAPPALERDAEGAGREEDSGEDEVETNAEEEEGDIEEEEGEGEGEGDTRAQGKREAEDDEEAPAATEGIEEAEAAEESAVGGARETRRREGSEVCSIFLKFTS